jgi:predicted ester cyclase
MFRDAFSDFAIVTDDMVAEGDKVFVRAHMTGTHRGEFMGIAATGRSINVPFADIVRFENGKVVEHWGITDTGAMMQQLGQAG